MLSEERQPSSLQKGSFSPGSTLISSYPPLPRAREQPARHRTFFEIWDRIATYNPRHRHRTWFLFQRSVTINPKTLSSPSICHIKSAGMYPSIPSIESEIWPLPRRSRAWGYTSRTRKTIRRVFGSCVVLVTVSKHTTNFRLWYTLRDSSRVTSVREFRWIKYPALRADVVQAVFTHHLNTRSLGLMYAFTSFARSSTD